MRTSLPWMFSPLSTWLEWCCLICLRGSLLSVFCTLCVTIRNWKPNLSSTFFHAMPLQGLREYCLDVQLCRESWSSLLWNLHGLKTRLGWCYNFVSTFFLLFLALQQWPHNHFHFLSIARLLWVSPNWEDGHRPLCLYALPWTDLLKVMISLGRLLWKMWIFEAKLNISV